MLTTAFEAVNQLKSDNLTNNDVNLEINTTYLNVHVAKNEESSINYDENEANEAHDMNDVEMEFENDEDNSKSSLDLVTRINMKRTNLNSNNKILQKKTSIRKQARNRNNREKLSKKKNNQVSNKAKETSLKAKGKYFISIFIYLNVFYCLDRKVERNYYEETINDSKLLPNHEISHEIIKNFYSCSCCKESFEKKDDCKNHQQTAHADILSIKFTLNHVHFVYFFNIAACQECDKIFSSKDSLRNHQKITHEKVPKKSYLYICEKCGKIFKQKQTLQNHRDSLCGTSLVFECEICHKKFTSVYIRRNHMKVHEAKKLLCKFCGKSFHWKGQLKVHERSHTGEKPYTCLYCPKAFSYRESLLTHSTIHTGIKPYICESCGNGFSCIGNLIKHRDAHVNVCGAYNKKQK